MRCPKRLTNFDAKTTNYGKVIRKGWLFYMITTRVGSRTV